MPRVFVIMVEHFGSDVFDPRFITKSAKKVTSYKRDIAEMYDCNFCDNCPYCEQKLCKLQVQRINLPENHTFKYDHLYDQGQPSRYVRDGFAHLISA